MEGGCEACYLGLNAQPPDHTNAPVHVEANHSGNPQVVSSTCTMADAPRPVQAVGSSIAALFQGIGRPKRMLNGQDQAGAGMTSTATDFGAKILDLAGRLAQWTELPEGLMCTFYSPAHKAAAAQLRDWMEGAGLSARIDAVGNVIGRYPSADPVGQDFDRCLPLRHRRQCRPVRRPAWHIDRRSSSPKNFTQTGRQLPFHLEVIGFLRRGRRAFLRALPRQRRHCRLLRRARAGAARQ